MKILVLLPRFPYPLDKGDKLRAYHQIVELSKKHEVYLFALSHKKVQHNNFDHLHTYCTAVNYVEFHWLESLWGIIRAFFSSQPLQLGYWNSIRARRAYKNWERQIQPDVVYCQMVRTIPMITGSPYRKVIDFQDALSLNTRRRMEHSHGLMRLILNYEYRALQRTEQQALLDFNATTIISDVDRKAISPQVTIVPNGVDTDYFSNKHLTPNTEYTICFTGNMSYAPNVDAAHYLVKEVMPLVWGNCPNAKVLLAGADPKPSVRALASHNVTISGRLPDIRTAYASAKIFVAPMRIGSGMQNKLLEAMSMGLPCVTTTLAAKPLGVTARKQLLVGDNATELADMIIKLLGSEELRNSITEEGHRFVSEHYSWPAAVEPLEKIFHEQLESK